MTRKMTHGILLLFLISLSNHVLAGTEGLCISKFNGFYIGGSEGGSINSAKQTGTINSLLSFTSFLFPDTLLTNSLDSSQNSTIKQSSVIGQLYAGYGRTWQMFYLGGEVFGNFSHYSMKNNFYDTGVIDVLDFDLGGIGYSVTNQNALSSEIKISPLQWGGDLRPGFLATKDLLLYGRVGFARSKVSLINTASVVAPYSYDVIFLPTFGQFMASTTLTSNISKHVSALRLGGGLEYSVNPHWSIRMDYIYVYYGKIRAAGNASEDVPSDAPVLPGEPGFFGAGTLNLAYTNNIQTIQTNTVMFGISYYPQIF